MRHVYVHVPFCRRRCSYCDFAIAVRRTVPSERFVERIRQEWALRRSALGAQTRDAEIETLYFGGGTPSLLHPRDLTSLIAFFRDEVGFAANPEITIEANPDDVDGMSAALWCRGGVNRVSLGVQSLSAAVLEWMHRVHESEDGLKGVALLKDAGLASVSVDLIFGLPEGLGADPADDLRRLLEVGPDHVSAYGLTVEAGTPLARWSARGTVAVPPDDAYAGEFLRVHETLAEAGFEHYEVSNFARPGRRSRHNQAYWRGRPYVGLGPSAHSFDGAVRRWNLREWARYEATVRSGTDPRDGDELLTAEQVDLERLYLGLRTREGVPPPAPGTPGDQVVQAALGQGWLALEGAVVRATPEGWLRLDALVSALTTSPDGG
ncbi:MAG: radical SAM family heme chaperone HemW [Gemmatimonadetes bacterium]|nr:radical SAM family heme chaperone HemW [Gemmatimonadota bacterium]